MSEHLLSPACLFLVHLKIYGKEEHRANARKCTPTAYPHNANLLEHLWGQPYTPDQENYSSVLHLQVWSLPLHCQEKNNMQHLKWVPRVKLWDLPNIMMFYSKANSDINESLHSLVTTAWKCSVCVRVCVDQQPTLHTPIRKQITQLLKVWGGTIKRERWMNAACNKGSVLFHLFSPLTYNTY